ncbi:BREX-1 system adenine-specific DNA-methyltransferase PglX, partial [Escherichia coli]|nr:BREX-1 system adenine-specific DNA-methyltransferase PglX [Escherichia coli]
METELKNFVSSYYPQGKADLYSSFMVRLLLQLKDNRTLSLMTPFTWMNLSSFEELRKIILTNFSIQSLVQPEYHSFFESAYVPICAFSI